MNKFKSFVKVFIIYDAVTFLIIKRHYVIYKREFYIIMKFTFKYYYLFRDSERHVIVHINHKPLIHFLNFNMHDEIYEH